MGFDIFLQRFDSGAAASVDPRVVEDVLAPHLRDAPHGGKHLEFSDGEAELYGADLGTGFMVTHASGREVWDVLVEVADRAGFAIIPVGCPVATTSEHARRQLPPDLADGAVVVRSGAELLSSIASA